MKWKALAPLVLAALIALATGPGRAQAIGGTYRVTAGGNQDWFPSSGGLDRTSSDPLLVSGTMFGEANAVGTADYELGSGPGIVRTKMSGSVTIPGGLFFPFNPSTQAVSTTELMISGPQVDLLSSLNVHVDGIVRDPVCNSQSSCGSLEVDARAASGQTDFDTSSGVRDNSLGLAIDPLPGGDGVRVHGDVRVGPLSIRPNLPFPITLIVGLSGRFGASGSFNGDFDDTTSQFQVSFAPSGPVLNDIPAGYTVSGPSVVDNHWTNPFAPSPPSGDVVVTDCGDPALAQLTAVHGNLVIRDVAGCTEVSLPNLTQVDGDIVIEDNDNLSSVDIGTGGVGVTVSGDLDISGNLDASFINVAGSGGNLTIVDNGDAVVNVSDGVSVSGDMTIETGGDPFSATTAGGTTDVTILGGGAALHAVLPAGAFDRPVAFTLFRTLNAPPETGTAADGSPAQIDPVFGYRFQFDVPTLNADARLSFTVDLSQLDANGRADLLNAIGAGVGTIAVKSDDANATFHAFAQCIAPATPSADGCVAVDLLKGDGTPAGPSDQPAFARFDGVVGHFSSYVVARVIALDTKAPTITVPAGIAVDATGPNGARVTYSASAQDDKDASPTLTCIPASESVFAIGDTTIVCNAKDASGNAASARFIVHVRGASEQILRLIDKTLAYLDVPALKPTLKATLQSAIDGLVAKRPRAVCLTLDVYIVAVKAARTGAFTAAERSELIADANRIRTVLAC